MIFAYFVCERCGKIVEFEKLRFHLRRAYCSDCANLNITNTCENCKDFAPLLECCIRDNIKHYPTDICAYKNKVYVEKLF